MSGNADRYGRERLYLQFRIGADRYALDCALVVEVLGPAPIKQLPGTPVWVLGLLDYRGHPLPVVDVSAAAGEGAAPRLTSTRIVVVRPFGQESARLLGLLLEGVTDTLRLDPDRFEPGGLRQDGAPFLGPVIRDARGLIQRADLDRLLDDEVKALLYPEPAP
ncbi:chemotaxis protein CheW [Bordetella avium]|uniref:chemotaxis protein CheW n=1 Tax=Bordetella avium TaxID=521 RepID=UPI000E0BE64C|nr:chemotaxis protein CheW [Bordetella avium]AZY48522.1 chemotaxis protein CheW [Bordetella avium]RIQ13830.1 purine-binding chemotaxis protein CheW [Bordetella avium]RIQ39526.1 purine-binding chemotaxis protein CheW [Bordetella avium]RIQ44325.1 purine-binding chemotaxis protein CheW [Bordetella avium]RIQ45457.1 purine-binding chemotaxis protein CheW [Bordetella avium]